MQVELKRYKSNKQATLGKLYINGQLACFTLEDEYRPLEEKVKGETRIPEGKYEITLRKFGGWHERMKRKFPEIHKGMLELMNVPGFTDILIHPGNTEKDTMGCILVGKEVDEANFTIKPGTSTLAYIKIYLRISEAIVRREKVWITITNAESGNVN